jgi:phosphoglycolate phosphatase-like HAD superfamily hydrolase
VDYNPISRKELAASLVRSLFCGLPRQEKRLAVFVSASDESDGGNHRSKFWHCGFIAPESDWYTYFAPAWQERVLENPNIPYLHMTDIRDHEWRTEHGITWLQAQDKMDEAAILIDQMGSLRPIAASMSGGAFLDAFGTKKIIQKATGKKGYRFLVDHFSFNAYVFTVLFYVKHRHPEAEKVDFLVERKEGVWELKQFYDTFDDALRFVGHEDLVPLLGEMQPGGKDRAPLQIADMLCWHTSRRDLGILTGRDAARGQLILKRHGIINPVGDDVIRKLASAFAEKMNEQEQRVPKIRRHDGAITQSAPQRDKEKTGRRKGRKGSKKAEA